MNDENNYFNIEGGQFIHRNITVNGNGSPVFDLSKRLQILNLGEGNNSKSRNTNFLSAPLQSIENLNSESKETPSDILVSDFDSLFPSLEKEDANRNMFGDILDFDPGFGSSIDSFLTGTIKPSSSKRSLTDLESLISDTVLPERSEMLSTPPKPSNYFLSTPTKPSNYFTLDSNSVDLTNDLLKGFDSSMKALDDDFGTRSYTKKTDYRMTELFVSTTEVAETVTEATCDEHPGQLLLKVATPYKMKTIPVRGLDSEESEYSKKRDLLLKSDKKLYGKMEGETTRSRGRSLHAQMDEAFKCMETSSEREESTTVVPIIQRGESENEKVTMGVNTEEKCHKVGNSDITEACTFLNENEFKNSEPSTVFESILCNEASAFDSILKSVEESLEVSPKVTRTEFRENATDPLERITHFNSFLNSSRNAIFQLSDVMSSSIVDEIDRIWESAEMPTKKSQKEPSESARKIATDVYPHKHPEAISSPDCIRPDTEGRKQVTFALSDEIIQPSPPSESDSSQPGNNSNLFEREPSPEIQEINLAEQQSDIDAQKSPPAAYSNLFERESSAEIREINLAEQHSDNDAQKSPPAASIDTPWNAEPNTPPPSDSESESDFQSLSSSMNEGGLSVVGTPLAPMNPLIRMENSWLNFSYHMSPNLDGTFVVNSPQTSQPISETMIPEESESDESDQFESVNSTTPHMEDVEDDDVVSDDTPIPEDESSDFIDPERFISSGMPTISENLNSTITYDVGEFKSDFGDKLMESEMAVEMNDRENAGESKTDETRELELVSRLNVETRSLSDTFDLNDHIETLATTGLGISTDLDLVYDKFMGSEIAVEMNDRENAVESKADQKRELERVSRLNVETRSLSDTFDLNDHIETLATTGLGITTDVDLVYEPKQTEEIDDVDVQDANEMDEPVREKSYSEIAVNNVCGNEVEVTRKLNESEMAVEVTHRDNLVESKIDETQELEPVPRLHFETRSFADIFDLNNRIDALVTTELDISTGVDSVFEMEEIEDLDVQGASKMDNSVREKSPGKDGDTNEYEFEITQGSETPELNNEVIHISNASSIGFGESECSDFPVQNEINIGNSLTSQVILDSIDRISTRLSPIVECSIMDSGSSENTEDDLSTDSLKEIVNVCGNEAQVTKLDESETAVEMTDRNNALECETDEPQELETVTRLNVETRSLSDTFDLNDYIETLATTGLGISTDVDLVYEPKITEEIGDVDVQSANEIVDSVAEHNPDKIAVNNVEMAVEMTDRNNAVESETDETQELVTVSRLNVETRSLSDTFDLNNLIETLATTGLGISTDVDLVYEPKITEEIGDVDVQGANEMDNSVREKSPGEIAVNNVCGNEIEVTRKLDESEMAVEVTHRDDLVESKTDETQELEPVRSLNFETRSLADIFDLNNRIDALVTTELDISIGVDLVCETEEIDHFDVQGANKMDDSVREKSPGSKVDDTNRNDELEIIQEPWTPELNNEVIHISNASSIGFGESECSGFPVQNEMNIENCLTSQVILDSMDRISTRLSPIVECSIMDSGSSEDTEDDLSTDSLKEIADTNDFNVNGAEEIQKLEGPTTNDVTNILSTEHKSEEVVNISEPMESDSDVCITSNPEPQPPLEGALLNSFTIMKSETELPAAVVTDCGANIVDNVAARMESPRLPTLQPQTNLLDVSVKTLDQMFSHQANSLHIDTVPNTGVVAENRSTITEKPEQCKNAVSLETLEGELQRMISICSTLRHNERELEQAHDQAKDCIRTLENRYEKLKDYTTRYICYMNEEYDKLKTELEISNKEREILQAKLTQIQSAEEH